MERPSFLKRRGDFGQDDNNAKKSKKDDNGKPKMSFAEKMMRRQGWTGGGLGREGEGIIEPIQVQVRPSGVGIGGTGSSEKTVQQKQEEKRQAERRGEEYEDSSEEERKARKRRAKIKTQAGISSNASTPRIKQKFTVEDIPEAMQVPESLKHIVDATGKETKLLTSTDSITLKGAVAAETPATKIAKRARLDLEAYASAFNDLDEEKKTAEYQETSLARELANIEQEIKKAQDIATAAAELCQLQTWDSIIAKLERMRLEDRMADSSVAVAALHPFFKQIMASWEPLDDALENIVVDILKIPALLSSSENRAGRDDFEKVRPQSTTPFETMFWTYFLPKLRSTIVNWDPQHESMSLIAVLAAWIPITPKFIQNSLIKQITAKLSAVVHAWNPRKSMKKRTTSQLPELITPWLPFLTPEHADPRASSGLVSDVKRKFRSLVDAWDLSRGVIPDTSKWKQLLGKEFDHVLVSHMLPRLANHLRMELEINPADQNVEPFNQVVQWTGLFKPAFMGELFVSVWFPKFFSILHLWLTSDGASYDEIGQFFQWWQSLFPPEVNELPAVSRKWTEALDLINTALDLGDRAKTDLPLPQTEVEKPSGDSPQPAKAANEPVPARTEVEEATFRDVVESWCGDENLLLIPLREAHEVTGSPLFRITASATGRGGVVVYLKGDVLYAQNKKDKGFWEPMGLEDRLVQRAEGK